MHVESARILIGFLKIFLIVKLSEALKNLTGLTTACMIQDVGNDQVSRFL